MIPLVSILPRIVGVYTGYDYEVLIVSNTAVSLDPTKYAPSGAAKAQAVLISVEDAPIRIRYDGGTPTANDGHLVKATDTFEVHGPLNISNIRFIASTAVNAVLRITYER